MSNRLGQLAAARARAGRANALAVQNAASDANRLRSGAYNALSGYVPPATAEALAGLLDYIPGVGDVSGFEDAYQAGASGDYGAAALLGAAGLVGLAPVVGDAAASGVRKGIRAYHGSPYDFDRFDISKIGTGEGGAVKGRGLNFTDDEGEAALYRNPDLQAGRVGQKSKFDGDGRVYEVEINASPEQFVDFDKPLKDQPEQVRSIIAPFVSEADEHANDRRLGFYIREDRGIEAKLQEAGYPGITAKLGRNTHHIVFDPDLITILRKYGLGALTVGGGYALTQEEYEQAEAMGL